MYEGDIEGRAVCAAGPVPSPLCYTLPPTQPSPRPRRARSVFPVTSRAPSGRRRQQRARPLPSSLDPGRPGLWPEGAWTPAQLPAPRACSRPTRRREILTQARKGDGGVMLGARLLGAVRVWAEAGRCLPAVVRLLLLRGHGQAALPGRPAGGLPWHLGGAPAQDGLNGEAGDAAGRRTPLACIFLAAHPGFIRNRRKPRTPFRDDLGGRWCRQAGGGRGGEGSQGEGAAKLVRRPLCAGDTRAQDGCAGILARPTLGAPAQPRRECPFLARQLAGSPPARRWRGLICIEVTPTRPIAAPPSGPGNFQKAQARHASTVRPGARREPGGHQLCASRDSRAESSIDSSPRFLAAVATLTARTPALLRGRGSAGLRAGAARRLPQATVLAPPEELVQAAPRSSLPSHPSGPRPAGRAGAPQTAAPGTGGRGVKSMRF